MLATLTQILTSGMKPIAKVVQDFIPDTQLEVLKKQKKQLLATQKNKENANNEKAQYIEDITQALTVLHHELQVSQKQLASTRQITNVLQKNAHVNAHNSNALGPFITEDGEDSADMAQGEFELFVTENTLALEQVQADIKQLKLTR